jgi:TPR repeat protein
MYRTGTGVAVNHARAAALYRKACENGYPPACEELKTLPAGR